MLIYVSTADVDSLCAFRVLKLMLRSDNVAYSVFPVSGYGELQRLGGEIPDDGQQRAIVLINCGGTEDVKSVLGLREGARACVLREYVCVCVRVCLFACLFVCFLYFFYNKKNINSIIDF